MPKFKQPLGEAESIKLRAIGEAEGIRATGTAKAETYQAGVAALGGQSYTAMQLMQIIGDRHVRLIPDVMVGGNNVGSNGLVDGLLSMILWNQTGHQVNGEITPPAAKIDNNSPPTVLENPSPTNKLDRAVSPEANRKPLNVTDNLKVKLPPQNPQKDDRP